ncbi:Complex I intermediate-associated protein 84 [Paramyrothecium foliicola]|nr:Complex I intermediate-associated protein 84 [Paramyrothecium foliicola]
MRPALARHARRLLVRRPNFPTCAAYAIPARRRPCLNATPTRTFQRTFLNALFEKAPRAVRPPEYEPGWMQIMLWRSRMLDNVRPPPRKELRDAWNKLMQWKLKNKMPMNSTQALQCRRLLEYLTAPSDSHQDTKLPSTVDLSMARKVLLDVEPQERSKNHLDLAKALYAVWESGRFEGKARDLELQWDYLVRSLSLYGGSKEALELLYSKWNDAEFERYVKGGLVEAVAEGLARENCETELVQLVEYAETHGVPFDAGLQTVMTCFFARLDRIPETQKWFMKPIEQPSSSVEAYQAIAYFAARNGLEEWAMPIFLELGQSQPRKKYWDVLLQAMLVLGKSIDDLGVIMSHMVDRNGMVSPTIQTFNGLLRTAVEMREPALAADLLSLDTTNKVSPNAETQTILLRLHLNAGLLDEARGIFQQLQSVAPGRGSELKQLGEYRQVINSYLVTLCQQSPPDFDFILRILESVEQGHIVLEPETAAALCLRFLENEQHFDVMDILSAHSFMYSEAQREVVQNAFVTFCLNPKTSTSRAWGAYQLLQQFFQDTSFDLRVQLMEAFFERKRTDMASHIFGHMRAHRNKSYHPKEETYVKCFEGFQRGSDLKSLEMVHNMLKMDLTIRPTTRLYTALMIAYTACGKPWRALDCWDEITRSQEGPSYASLEAVFWALEGKANGDAQARDIWEKLERMDVEVSPAVYNAYVGAIAGNGREQEVRTLITQMASFVGVEPDVMTLGIAYNALPGSKLQADFQEWAQKRYRGVWEEAEKKGRRMTEHSLWRLKINRVLKA